MPLFLKTRSQIMVKKLTELFFSMKLTESTIELRIKCLGSFNNEN